MLRSVHTSQQLYFYPNITRKRAAHHHNQACDTLLTAVPNHRVSFLRFGLRRPSFSSDMRAAAYIRNWQQRGRTIYCQSKRQSSELECTVTGTRLVTDQYSNLTQ